MQKYKAREINVQQKFFFPVPKKAETRSEFGAGCPKKKKKQKKDSSSDSNALRVILWLPSCLTRRMRNMSNFGETLLRMADYKCASETSYFKNKISYF